MSNIEYDDGDNDPEGGVVVTRVVEGGGSQTRHARRATRACAAAAPVPFGACRHALAATGRHYFRGGACGDRAASHPPDRTARQ